MLYSNNYTSPLDTDFSNLVDFDINDEKINEEDILNSISNDDLVFNDNFEFDEFDDFNL